MEYQPLDDESLLALWRHLQEEYRSQGGTIDHEKLPDWLKGLFAAGMPQLMPKFFLSSTLSRESERGCILIGTALIDRLLERLLRARFKRDGHLPKDDIEFLLSKGPVPPLRPFAMRIIFAHAFGLISDETRKALDSIREVRNRCGHFHGEFTINLDDIKPAMEVARKHPFVKHITHEFDDPSTERKAQFSYCLDAMYHELGKTLRELEGSQSSEEKS